MKDFSVDNANVSHRKHGLSKSCKVYNFMSSDVALDY